MGFQFERGFRRITTLTSATILVLGTAAWALLTWNAWYQWSAAIRQPDGPQLVAVPGVGGARGGYVLFRDGASEETIRRALANAQYIPADGFVATQETLAGRESKTWKDDPVQLTDVPSYRGIELAYVGDTSWRAEKDAQQPRRFYTRRAVKEQWAAGTLPDDVLAMVTAAPTFTGRYATRPAPWAIAAGAGLVLVGAAIPWAIFFVARWLIRGFIGPS